MTFDTLKALGKREAFTIIEIILDKNDPALDGEFALQADSYGTPKTTDDIRAFTGVDFRTYRYADQQIFGIDHFPNLGKVTSNTPEIDPGKSIGFRATATATIQDFICNDAYSLPSPYDDRRIVGSHFLKLLARNHVKNRRVRVLRGLDPLNYSESNTTIENYIIDSISFPSENGQVSIKMVDELILAESIKTKLPTISKGVLTTATTPTDTTLAFSSTVTDEYGATSATGYIAIEKEVMSYTVDSSTAMTITRGAFGTEAVRHEVDETMQKCIVFDNVNIIDIITQIITDHTDIPASYIPTADFAALKTGDLALYNLTRVIYKQTDVKKVLNELIQLAGLSVYVDIVKSQLTIVSIPDFSLPVVTFNESEHIEQGSVKVTQDYKRQITRQSIFWDKSDSSESDDTKNYRKSFQVIDGIVEQAADVGTISEPKPLITNWLINSSEDNQLATSFCQRQVNRFSKIPLVIKFDVDQRYIGNVTGGVLWLGSVFAINTSRIVDSGLNNVTTTAQCIKIKPAAKDGQWTVTGLSYTAATPISADLFISEDKIDYLLTDELTTTEAREYVVVINSGVTIGSSLSSLYSFTQGTFFSGATLKLVVLGRGIGTGGAGGNGGDSGVAGAGCVIDGGSSGGAGGGVFSFSTDATIDNGFGVIFSGGNGGNGGNSVCYEDAGGDYQADGGSGGGGGQGYSSSVAGIIGTGGIANGTSGNLAAPGLGGIAGDSGGGFGSDGGTFGGGIAINSNGNTVTITAGNNAEQIKGSVI